MSHQQTNTYFFDWLIHLYVPPYNKNTSRPIQCLSTTTHIGVWCIPSFFVNVWFLPHKFEACSKPLNRDNHRKASYPTQTFKTFKLLINFISTLIFTFYPGINCNINKSRTKKEKKIDIFTLCSFGWLETFPVVGNAGRIGPGLNSNFGFNKWRKTPDKLHRITNRDTKRLFWFPSVAKSKCWNKML